MKISENDINDIRNSANIVDVIGHYIPLTKYGKNYRAICPFHDDHDPSLSISVDKQIYKCFVCQNGGNVFTFVQNYKKISFLESVVEVSKIIGKPLNVEIAPKVVSKNQPYYDLLNSFITYSQYLLSASNLGLDAMKYLENRGINKEIIEYFNIGLNPDDNKMYKYLSSQKYTDENMIKCGIARMLNNGMADVFYNRITFPIHDKFGNPLAFTARDYLGKSDSKYINSNENIIYTKGDNLYNYHRAKEQIRKSGYVIVCEGVMDVIAYYRASKYNVVATLGTACSAKQLELLKELSNHVVLSYDGDKAGQSANLKLGERLLDVGVNVSVIDNQSELDPDEIINKYGSNALKDLESKRISYIDFAIKYYKKNFNLENYEDRKNMTLLVSKLIDKLNDKYDKDNYANELYEITKIRIRESENSDKRGYNDKVAKVNTFSIDGLTKAEYTILVEMAMSKKGLDIYQRRLGYLLQESSQDLAMLIIDDYRKNDKCSLSRIYDETDDERIKSTITNLALLEGLPTQYKQDILDSAIEKVLLEMKKKKLTVLKELISKNETIDPKQAQEYLKEYVELVKEMEGKDGK